MSCMWIDIDPADVRPGDIANHVEGLDSREVTRVDGSQVWLYLLTSEGGPFPKMNYTFKRRIDEETVGQVGFRFLESLDDEIRMWQESVSEFRPRIAAVGGERDLQAVTDLMTAMHILRALQNARSWYLRAVVEAQS